MKKLLLLLCLAISLAIASCESGAQEGNSNVEITAGGPLLTLAEEEHEFGQIKKDSEAICSFKVTNTGDQPLIISKCKASCGCTVPECDPTPILPGAANEIKVQYKTDKLGTFNKFITITSNSKDSTEVKVRIKGEVIE
ncbi:MAG: DUF1573 domain-containing protein [Flavobacteriales bacterium]|nr:DUF1573 domain-containing protein [Flavobacteriales bacterium]